MEELGFIFIWEIVRYLFYGIVLSSQQWYEITEIELSKYFLLAKPYEYKDTSTCLFNKQDIKIYNHS